MTYEKEELMGRIKQSGARSTRLPKVTAILPPPRSN